MEVTMKARLKLESHFRVVPLIYTYSDRFLCVFEFCSSTGSALYSPCSSG
jgi:hypothetical protein